MAQYYFSFDVESDGLFGSAFAVGWVIVDDKGNELEEGYLGCPHPFMAPADNWVIKNVLPALPKTDGGPTFGAPWANCYNRMDMVEFFWDSWKQAKQDYPGIMMVTDCPFPVEAGFLLEIVKEYRPHITMEESPYPIIDVASLLVQLRQDPLADYDRLDTELPKHNPVCDARQSVRIMLWCLDQCTHVNVQ